MGHADASHVGRKGHNLVDHQADVSVGHDLLSDAAPRRGGERCLLASPPVAHSHLLTSLRNYFSAEVSSFLQVA